MPPLVTIVTPLHNAGPTIEGTMDSVAAQTLGDYEHLIIDNLSTDDGVERVQKRAQLDDRIQLLSQNEMSGAGPTRNVGIANAKGRYIAFLDADDTWHPDKLKKQVAHMKANDLAFSWTSYDVDTGRPGPKPVRQTKPNATSKDLLSKRAVIGCLTAAYDTQKLGKVYMSDIKKRQDFVLFVKLLRMSERKGFKVGGLTETLATYRLQDGSLSSDKKSAAQYQWKALTQECGLSNAEALLMFFSYAVRGVADRIKLRQKK